MSLFPRRLLLTGSLALACFSSRPVAAAPGLAEAIILTPQSGTSADDLEIVRWQTKAASTGARLETFERLGWAYIAKARRTLDAGYYKLAEETAAAMDARFGATDEARLLRGHVLHNLHRFHEAELIAQGLVDSRGLPSDFALLSDVLMERGDLARAVNTLQRLVELRPGAEAYSRIAHVRWLKGDLTGAIASMDLAIHASSPAQPAIYAWLLCRQSGYFLQTGELERALAFADAADRAAGDFAPAQLARGRCLFALGRTEAAIQSLERAERLNPLPEYQWWLADALRSAGRATEATDVESRIMARGERADPRTLALFLASRGETAALALRLADEERAARDDVFTRDAYAWALAKSGDNHGAESAMSSALSEKTQDARLFLHAGIIALNAGRAEAARAYFAQALPFENTLTPSERAQLRTHSAATAGVARAN